MKRFLCILNLVLGLSLVAVTGVHGYQLGVWVDENPAPNFPGAIPEFILVLLGFIICIVSLVQLLTLNSHQKNQVKFNS